jgi:hypothetical protein
MRGPSKTESTLRWGLALMICPLLCLQCELITPLDYLSADRGEHDAPEAGPTPEERGRDAMVDSATPGPSIVDSARDSNETVTDAVVPVPDAPVLPPPDSAPPVSYVEAVKQDAPLAYWRFGERPPSTQARDEMGKYPGAYAGGVTLAAPGAIAQDPDTAIQLDGMTGRVTFGPILPFIGNAPFTLEAWVYPLIQDNAVHRIINNRNPSGNDGYRLILNYQGVKCERFDAAVTIGAVAAMVAFNQYTHVVCTYDGAHMKLFINGVSADSAASGGAIPDYMLNFTIGSMSAGVSELFQGRIDEVAVYGVALSEPRAALHFRLGHGH